MSFELKTKVKVCCVSVGKCFIFLKCLTHPTPFLQSASPLLSAVQVSRKTSPEGKKELKLRMLKFTRVPASPHPAQFFVFMTWHTVRRWHSPRRDLRVAPIRSAPNVPRTRQTNPLIAPCWQPCWSCDSHRNSKKLHLRGMRTGSQGYHTSARSSDERGRFPCSLFYFIAVAGFT